MLTKLLRAVWPNPQKRRAADVYIALVNAARNPFFYEQWKVADTVDGRFDMIVLHLALVVERLDKSERAALIQLRNALMEYAIEDMDRNLREMGVSDTSVSKKMKKLAGALNGRFVAYGKAQTHDEWAKSLTLNIYRSDNAEPLPSAADMAHYAIALREGLAKAEDETLLEPSHYGKIFLSAGPENTSRSDAA